MVDNTLSENEISVRFNLYKSELSKSSVVGDFITPFVNSEKDFVHKEEVNVKNIFEIMYLCKNDEAFIYVKDSGLNIPFNFDIYNGKLRIENPFIHYSENKKISELDCFIEFNGILYNFFLGDIKAESSTSVSLRASIPKIVYILKRRFCERVSNKFKKFVVGFFLPDNEKEFLGVVKNISESGICISFNEDFLDNDFITLMKDDINYKIPIILDTEFGYETFLIDLRSVVYKKNIGEINIGASFFFRNIDEVDKIKTIFLEIKKAHDYNYKKMKSEDVIKLSKIEA